MQKYFYLLVVSAVIQFNLQAQFSVLPAERISRAGGGTNASYLDFDGDGNVDLLFSRPYQILLKKGLGTGQFAEEQELYASDDEYIQVISNFGDIDGDENMDVVFLTETHINLLLGGDDELSLSESISFDLNPYELVKLEDFNSDGNLDIIVASNAGLSINYDPSNDLNSFEDLMTHSSLITTYNSSDFNLDGNQDLVVATVDKFEIYLNNETEGFSRIHQEDGGFKDAEIGDVDLDTYPDVLYGSGGSDVIQLLVYDDENQVFESIDLLEGKSYFNVRQPTLLDIDDNGTLDILFSNSIEGLSYMPNSGGEFSEKVDINIGDISSGYNGIFSIDLNNDEINDLVVHGWDAFDVILLDDSQVSSEIFHSSLDNASSDLINVDLNEDEYTDLICITGTGHVIIRWGSASYDYKTEDKYTIPKYATTGVLYDIDEDGFDDLVFVIEKPSGIDYWYYMSGDGSGGFDDYTYLQSGSNPSKSVLVDMDNSKNQSIWNYNKYGNDISWFGPDLEKSTVETEDTSAKLNDASYGNLNDDDFMDMVAARDDRKVSLFISDEEGTYAESILTIDEDINGVQILDFNLDGKSDILVTVIKSNQEQLFIYLADESNGFEYSESFTLDTYKGKEFSVLDIDGDEDDDFIVSSSDHSRNNVFENRGDQFVKSENSFDDNNGGVMVFFDLNADNKIDAITSIGGSGNLITQLNNSVLEPSVGDLKLLTMETTYSSLKIEVLDLENTGYLSIVVEGKVGSLEKTPEDAKFYAASSTFGAGDEFDGGYLVYDGAESEFEITGLDPNTEYSVFLFSYQQDEPINSIINYSEDFLVASILTATFDPSLEDVTVEISNVDSDGFEAEIAGAENMKLLVVLEESLNATTDDLPENGTEYEASLAYGAGSQIGKGSVLISGDVQTFEVSGLNSETSYSMFVYAFHEANFRGDLYYSSDVVNAQVTTPFVLSAAELFESKISVFPNPTDGKLTINTPFVDQKVEIINVSGKVMYESDQVGKTIDLSGWPLGIYLLKTEGEVKRIFKK